MSRVAVALDPAVRVKLVGILGMLGSDFDGERASAGLLASRLLKDHGLRWDDLIPPAIGIVAAQDDRPDLTLCLRHNALLTDWERNFVQSIASRRVLSPKQSDVLHRIAGTLRDRGCE
jgi:hypothetical protein